jgi:hypothetical protein
MKKAFLFLGIFIAVLAIAGTAFVVNAQNNNPPAGETTCPGFDGEQNGWFGRGGMRGFGHGGMMGFGRFSENGECPGFAGDGEFGPMHDTMTQALADATGLSVEEINQRLADGEHHYEIALDAGLTEEDLQTLMEQVHESFWGENGGEGFQGMPYGRMHGNWSDGETPGYGQGCHGGEGRPGMFWDQSDF